LGHLKPRAKNAASHTMLTSLSFVAALALGASALVAPAHQVDPLAEPVELEKRAVTTLDAATIAGFAPYTQIARAAYCAPSKITNWNCGEACAAVPGIKILANGGDGNSVQYF
jgi:hypothetical protein